MSFIIGYLNGEPQELTLINGMVHINNQIQPIKNVTEEEIRLMEQALEDVPEGDEEGREAFRNARRIEFLVSLLSRTFGDEATDFLEQLIGNLHYRVLEYLGETDDLDDYVEERMVLRSRHSHDHDHDHDHGCTCGCDHHHED